MESWLIILGLATWQTLGLALADCVILYVCTQNLGLNVAESGLVTGILTVVLAVCRLFLAPLLDEDKHPRTGVLVTVLSLVLHGLLVLVIPWEEQASAASTEDWRLVATLALWIVLSGMQFIGVRFVRLALKRAIAERPALSSKAKAEKDMLLTRVFGFFYGLENVCVLVALGLYFLLKWAGEMPEARANIAMIVLAAAARVVELALWAVAWSCLVQLDDHTPRSGRSARAHWRDSVGRHGCRGLGLLWCQGTFWAFTALVFVLLFAEAPATAVELGLPRVMRRASEQGSTLFTVFQMINPAVVVACTPVMQLVVATHLSGYTLLGAGTLLSSAALLFPALAPEDDQWPVLVFLVVYSIAEAVWSARVQAYVLSLAPRGRESLYLAVGEWPKTLGRLGLRGLLGVIVERYCPKDVFVPCHARPIWASALGLSLATPVLLGVFCKCLDLEWRERQADLAVVAAAPNSAPLARAPRAPHPMTSTTTSTA